MPASSPRLRVSLQCREPSVSSHTSRSTRSPSVYVPQLTNRWPLAANGSTVRHAPDPDQVKSGAHPTLFRHFGDRAICGDDEAVVGRGKPTPDIFLVAAHHGLGLQHSEEGRRFLDRVRPPGAEHDGTLRGAEHEILVFEDALPGVQAGLAAGMRGTFGSTNTIQSCGSPIPMYVQNKGYAHAAA